MVASKVLDHEIFFIKNYKYKWFYNLYALAYNIIAENKMFNSKKDFVKYF